MQGFNMGRYVPPEHEGLTSGNALNKKHALGARASKLSTHGILTVRFEMPYAIWCTTCPKPTIIGQGVRFNAEKKKTGSYYSTPIYTFRFKHTECGGWIEIRTDPKNTAYVVVSGARARDTGEDKVREGDVEILTEEEREKRRNDAFASLEVKIDDRKRIEGAKRRIDELLQVQSEAWEDPYARNRKLRAVFREGRKEREREAGRTESLRDKLSLGIELLPESEEDALRAGFVDFGVNRGDGHDGLDGKKAISKPLFALPSTSTTTTRDSEANSKSEATKDSKSKKSSSKLKAEQVAEKRKADLAAEIRDNTRAKIDPFLHHGGDEKKRASSKVSLGIKKRKGVGAAVADVGPGSGPLPSERMDDHPATSSSMGLVDYDSD